MKNTNLIFKLFCAAIVTASVVTACYDDMDEVSIVKLGTATTDEYIVSAVRNTFDIEIYANGPYHIERDESEDWLTLTPGEIVDGRAVITAECSANSRFKRATLFVLCSDVDTRRDTVTVKQQGLIEAYIEFDDASVTISQYAGETIDSLRTNVLVSEMTIDINYSDEEDWITDIEIINGDSDDGTIRITATENTSDGIRIAPVTLSFTDGWGDEVEVMFNVVQLNANGELGTILSIAEFRDAYADLGNVLDYVLVEGYVVSNPDSHNAGEAERITLSTVDYLPIFTTVYLESLDGSVGMKFVTDTWQDNVFDQFDHVVLLMKGTTPVLKTNPTRLDVEGVNRAMVVSKIAGTKADIPIKDRTIGTLTDEDVYTFVRLNDVELPIRKGSLYPISEGSTIAFNSFSMDNVSSVTGKTFKYGTLVRGKDGNSLYMWTNDPCEYRRSGRRLPQGSGTISGVIVHERYSLYEWANGADPTEMEYNESLGNVGRYQIRHQCEGDIWDEMNMDFKDSFSELLCEYRYWKWNSQGHCLPTYCKEELSIGSNGGNTDDFAIYQNGWLTHTYQTAYTGDSNKNQSGTSSTHVYTVRCYDYLGPIGGGDKYYFGANYGNRNGCGIIIDPQHDWLCSSTSSRIGGFSFAPDGTYEYAGQYATDAACGNSSAGTGWVSNEDCANNPDQLNYGSSSNRGRGMCENTTYMAWGGRTWWDYDTDRFYSFLLMFSTAGISTDQISLQISVFNRYSSYGPRYWRAEWAFTDSQDPKDDDQWNYIGDYTVSEVIESSAANWYAMTGYKQLNFALPLEILGHEEVYIRLHPINDLCSDLDDYSNAHLCDYGDITASQHTSALNYVAIRYNK